MSEKHKHHEQAVSTSVKPTIVLQEGKIRRAVRQAANALWPRCEELRIFQRGGELIRVVCIATGHKDRWLKRPEGSMQLQPLSSVALTDAFNKVAIWKQEARNNIVQIDCPPEIARYYHSRVDQWRVPVLAGIISTPVLRSDGMLLQKPGYDAESQLLLLVDNKDWPAIPEHPTRADALAALQRLREPFEQFPWAEPAGESVHIAAILTAIQRRFLPACPLFGYDAPTQRSGKSMLAESVAIIATGKPAAATTFPGQKEEIKKSILAVLRTGLPITNFDNVEHVMSSPDLAKAITQTEYQDRVLGSSTQLTFSTRVLWTVTGNNLRFKGDLTSRALCCRIDAGEERPETRTFKINNLPEYIKARRKELVVAALTILRAYREAGSPRQKVEPWGGFNDWSREIREALVWLDMPDPCKTRENILADDPERAEFGTALRALHETFGEKPFLTKKIIHKCVGNGVLRIALAPVAGDDKGVIDARRMGEFMKRTKDRIIEGFRLQSGIKVHGATQWYVKRKISRFPRYE